MASHQLELVSSRGSAVTISHTYSWSVLVLRFACVAHSYVYGLKPFISSLHYVIHRFFFRLDLLYHPITIDLHDSLLFEIFNLNMVNAEQRMSVLPRGKQKKKKKKDSQRNAYPSSRARRLKILHLLPAIGARLAVLGDRVHDIICVQASEELVARDPALLS